jgi:hypothetical protein
MRRKEKRYYIYCIVRGCSNRTRTVLHVRLIVDAWMYGTVDIAQS